MKTAVRFPIRLKILVALLFVVTGVVSVIVLTMASLFHDDKKAYITDLVSMTAASAAEEAHSLLLGYRERLKNCARIMANDSLPQETRVDLLEAFFDDFPELVAIALQDEGGEIAAVYNNSTLEAAGLTRSYIADQRLEESLPLQRILQGEDYLRNSTMKEKLPTLTLVTVAPQSDSVVVSAVIRLDALLQLAARSSAIEVFLIDDTGTFLAHADASRVASYDQAPESPDASPETDWIQSTRVSEYEANGVAMIGGFAATRFGGVTVGAQIPRSAAFLASGELLGRLIAVALVLLVGATLVGLLWAHRLTGPIARLTDATQEIAKGRFDIEIQVESHDEIGALAGSFNQMASELSEREQALEQAQAALIHSEKMAAFGQLGAGIAHEVKNPLAGILGCAQLSLRNIDPETPVGRNLKLIEKETKRCKEIIDNLMRFARQEKAVLQSIEVSPVISDVAAIVSHQLGMHGVQLVQELAQDLPQVHGNANQLQQVLMNLMMNAQQAMEGGSGIITVSTRLGSSGRVEIAVADDGPGIPPEIRKKLFDPFFTTKPGGKGTGLGLSVSFGIIEDHGGEITVSSTGGEGATFVISLPPLQDSQDRSHVATEGPCSALPPSTVSIV